VLLLHNTYRKCAFVERVAYTL